MEVQTLLSKLRHVIIIIWFYCVVFFLHILGFNECRHLTWQHTFTDKISQFIKEDIQHTSNNGNIVTKPTGFDGQFD